jgi:hypothetical protein
MGNIVSEIDRAITGEISPEEKIKVYKFVLISELKEKLKFKHLNPPDSYPVCINFEVGMVGDGRYTENRLFTYGEQDIWKNPYKDLSINTYACTLEYFENKIPAKVGLYKWQYDQIFG